VSLSFPSVPIIADLTEANAPLNATCSIDQPKFFKYVIKDSSDLEDLMILLNVSERSKLQLYLHWTNYPSAKTSQHDYCLGAVQEEPLRKMLSDRFKTEIFVEESPYAYDSTTD
jgi:hypothetical protein